MTSLQDRLNEPQWEAVTYCDGPSLVIAGAGSGKTRVLTYKIAYLISRGMDPGSILALTFTNKAAGEMSSRIATVVGTEAARRIWSGTFHSIFSRILRREADFVGFTSDFTIYDSANSQSLIKAIVKELALDDKVYKPRTIAARISEAKNGLVLPEAYNADASISHRDAIDNIGRTGEIYTLYCQRCRTANAMDFDDLLLNTFLLFREHPEVCEKYRRRFQYILVDEYQDTNAAQHRIISQLTTPTSRICVVGDDAQSIYAFRGARIDNILGFMEQYPTARLIKLERNYRSTKNIVGAANSLIGHNARQIPKNVYSEAEEGAPLKLIKAVSDKEESLKVTGEIRRLVRREGLAYNDIALLYRTNAQSRSFEEEFRAEGIPYRIHGGTSFYQRKEIMDVIAYCRLTANPNDDEAFKRIINYPARGIGQTTVGKLQTAAVEHGVPLWSVACDPAAHGVAVNRGTASKIAAFVGLIEGYRSRLKTTAGSLLTADIIRTAGIGADLLSDKTAEGESRKQNVEELLGAIQANEEEIKEETGRTVVPMTEYLAQVSLLTDADRKEDDTPRVTLMTVHAAKGLEYDAVFVTGMEEDLFPNANARFMPSEMEEERRLFYVAITRAKRFCFLSYAGSRYRYGRLDFCEPSPFLKEIDSRYVTTDGNVSNHSAKDLPFAQPKPASTWSQRKPLRPLSSLRQTPAATTPASATPAASSPYAVGDTVEHARFGIGTIVSLEGSGPAAKACVDFRNAGQKNLLLKYANLKRL